jgi:hypothetical protein
MQAVRTEKQNISGVDLMLAGIDADEEIVADRSGQDMGHLGLCSLACSEYA